MPRKPREIDEVLKSKFGFTEARSRSTDHRWYELRLEGLPVILTKVSHSKGEAMIDHRIGDIRSHFAAVVGATIVRYETAELLLDDGTWDSWTDLPIRLYTDASKLIAISWSGFDDLWITEDFSLPFSIEGSTIRWVDNRLVKINAAIGASIRSVMLGQGEMSIDEREVEIWSRILVQLDKGWLEIFNALDGNGYDFHTEKPTGRCIPCI